ncbi:MAG: peptidoglycan D,D-transpeptidase FtsI family protein [Candidatus Flexifilum sp.]|jgi:cell division protein FtsI/penicillin-binding protein 2
MAATPSARRTAGRPSPLPPQVETLRRRLPVVILGLFAAAFILFGRLASFQFQLPTEVLAYLDGLRDSLYTRTLQLAAARGLIYDRHGEALAVNTLEYQIGASPSLVTDARQMAVQLASILGRDERELFAALTSDAPWVLLAPRVSAEVGQRINQLDLGSAITISPIPRRSYPQGGLASQVIGFVGGDLRGYYGIEGYYDGQLSGRTRDQRVSNIPFDVPDSNLEPDRGADIVLTIDRDVQYIAETELMRAIAETGATRGTIIIMEPRTGDVLAMASFPTFDPNAYFQIESPDVLRNIAIADNYEPGSVMKVITIAAALEQDVIEPDFTYNDQGALELGGITVRNWDRRPHGLVDATQILVQSLNVGAATVSTMMGPDLYYGMMRRFNFGRLTGIDLQGEEAGTMHIPGDPDWSEANLLTNSFGQAIAVTPLQMLTAINAIANNGLMMQPNVVHQIIDGDQVINTQPAALGRPISAETAAVVRDMMVQVVQAGLDETAGLPGYTIAGKTGTAEIPTPVGYEQNASIVTFVGFLPADDPVISVLVRLDRPRDYWASLVAAPVFQRLAQRLVVLLEIPPDAIRRQIAAQGGSISGISR